MFSVRYDDWQVDAAASTAKKSAETFIIRS